MAEYIDKQAFNDAIREAVRRYPNTFYNGLEVARKIAHDMDASDVQPVRHGRWIKCTSTYCMCTACERYWIPIDDQYDYRYCPNCGAKMYGEA